MKEFENNSDFDEDDIFGPDVENDDDFDEDDDDIDYDEMHKKSELRIAEFVNKIVDLLMESPNQTIELEIPEYIGRYGIKAVFLKGNEIYIKDHTGYKTDLDEFYIACDTDFTFEDYVEEVLRAIS